ncbi:E3 ubiquitin-protein ligase RNF216 [Lepeophtheirus salmonis]|uniref:RING-type domain-containing protein n=2 Tax=Lepeophtheirus salmonis TaxID=72036 RepID=A0A0K2TB99_LEPSM|nr:E3 ubiquitin-protein ligase RNF216-like [Lepeophtheirus salmonis]
MAESEAYSASLSNGLYTQESLDVLKGMFPEKDEFELTSLLKSYPGKYMEGLIDKILQGVQVRCLICWEDLYMEDVISCDGDHPVCRSCLTEGIKNQLADGLDNYICLNYGCEIPYQISDLETVMDHKMITKYIQTLCSNEVKSCGEFGLYTCSECNYAVTIDKEGLDVIKCQYQYCKALTCIHCQLPAHPRGQTCQKLKVEKLRLKVEDSMANAVIRKCHACAKPYTKTDGCNRIQCICGAQMCYICKKKIQPNYDHFYDFPEKPEIGKCPLQTNSEDLHHVERTSAARKTEATFDHQLSLPRPSTSYASY